MTGTFEGFRVTFGSFGQQYVTIDGLVYLTSFDAADPKLRGVGEGAVVEFEVRPDRPCSVTAREDLSSARHVRVVRKAGDV